MKDTKKNPRAAAGAVKPRRRHDEEFKMQAVQLLEEGPRTQQALAAELGISAITLGQWKRRYGVAGAQAPLDGPAGPLQSGRSAGRPMAGAMEVARLQRELEYMTRQRDILKKALSIFSQSPLHALR